MSNLNKQLLAECSTVVKGFHANSGGCEIYMTHNDDKVITSRIHFHNDNRRHIKIERFGICKNDYYRRGLGTALMKYILKWCKRNQIITIRVRPYASTHRISQADLVLFYESFGFTPINNNYLCKNIRRTFFAKPPSW